MNHLVRVAQSVRPAGRRGFHVSAFVCGGARPGGKPVFTWKQRKELGLEHSSYGATLKKQQPLYEFSKEFDLSGWENVTNKDFSISRVSSPDEELQQWMDARKKVKMLCADDQMPHMATIVVKRIPVYIPDEAVHELLGHVGAKAIRRLPIHSKYLGMVFADFTSVELATRAVIYLCNLRLGQSSIIAELAHSDSTVQSDTELHERNTGAHVGNDRKREPMAPLLGLTHEMDKDLEYVYPPATPTVVHNIAQTILAVPRLYTQVLHLMNKMNLPAPFHAKDIEALQALTLEQRQQRDAKRSRGLEPDESELESSGDDDDLDKQRKKVKKKLASDSSLQSTQVLVATCDVRSVAPHHRLPLPQAQSHPPRRFQQRPFTDPFKSQLGEASRRTGLYPRPGIVAVDELEERRIPPEELQRLLPTTDADIATPNRMLYLKNLAKSIHESDLRYIFHIFFATEEEAERNCQVRVMQSGRMRRQAFVVFPSESLATLALATCNGLIVDGKPIVMQYAKSK